MNSKKDFPEVVIGEKSVSVHNLYFDMAPPGFDQSVPVVGDLRYMNYHFISDEDRQALSLEKLVQSN